MRVSNLIRLLRTAPLSRIALWITPFEPWAILVRLFWSTALMVTKAFEVLYSPFTWTVTGSLVQSLYALPHPTFHKRVRFRLVEGY